MRIVDAHNHPDWHGHDFDGFVSDMDRNGIAVTWLLTWECPPDEYDPAFNGKLPNCLSGEGCCPIPFARCLEYYKRAPGRFILGYAPDPRRPDAIDRLRAAVEIYGVKVYGELKVRMMYDNRDAIRMYRFCGSMGLPVLVHIDYEFDRADQSGNLIAYPRPNYWYGGGIDAFERAVKECPETIFIGHAPGFWAHISNDEKYLREAYPAGVVKRGGKLPKMLRKHPNLYCDISAGSGYSALSRDLEFARDFLAEFQDRVLFGRDFFDSRHRDLLDSLHLPAGVAEKIFHVNAETLVGNRFSTGETNGSEHE